MKRCTSILALILILALQMPVQAISPRVNFFSPSLSFDGTTAKCSIYARGAPTDEISVALELRGPSGRVGYWTNSDTERVVINESATVVRGQTYELTATVRINGKWAASAPVSGTCP